VDGDDDVRMSRDMSQLGNVRVSMSYDRFILISPLHDRGVLDG
jgi:hypothetical protein